MCSSQRSGSFIHLCGWFPALSVCLSLSLSLTVSLALSVLSLSLSQLPLFLLPPIPFHYPSAASDITSMSQMPVPYLFQEDMQLSFFFPLPSDFLSVLCRAALKSVFVELLWIKNWHAEDIPPRALALTFLRQISLCWINVIRFYIVFFFLRRFSNISSLNTFLYFQLLHVKWILLLYYFVQEPELWSAPGASQCSCDWSHAAWHPASVHQHSVQPEIHQQVSTPTSVHVKGPFTGIMNKSMHEEASDTHNTYESVMKAKLVNIYVRLPRTVPPSGVK